MPVDLDLEISSGTIYGEILKGSGITVPNARYITAEVLASQLIGKGVWKSQPELILDMRGSSSYGENDNIWTRVQGLRAGNYMGSESYVYNPWKELMREVRFDNQSGFDFCYQDLSEDGKQPVTILLDNPMEGIIRLQSMFALLTEVDASDLDEFLTIVGTHTCTLIDELYSPFLQDSIPETKLAIQRMKMSVPQDRRGDLRYVLDLISGHNICTLGKEAIVRMEIEELLRFDTSRIPTKWEQGTLDDAVITEEMVKELNKLLK